MSPARGEKAISLKGRNPSRLGSIVIGKAKEEEERFVDFARVECQCGRMVNRQKMHTQVEYLFIFWVNRRQFLRKKAISGEMFCSCVMLCRLMSWNGINGPRRVRPLSRTATPTSGIRGEAKIQCQICRMERNALRGYSTLESPPL